MENTSPEAVSLKSANNLLMTKRSVSYYVLARCLFSLSLKSAELSTYETDSLSVFLNPLKPAVNGQLRKLTVVSVFCLADFKEKGSKLSTFLANRQLRKYILRQAISLFCSTRCVQKQTGMCI